VLEYAAQETPASDEISTVHILLGILRLETSFAAEILHEYGLSLESVRQELQGTTPIGSVKRAHAKPTACRDCKHLVIDGPKGIIVEWTNLFCGASPKQPEFDFYTGELKEIDPETSPSKRLQPCAMINFGECRLFDPKDEGSIKGA
jgi:hypothetical protein